MQPYTKYEYQVMVNNSVGSAVSQWAQVTTLEAAPTGQSSPTVTALGAYTVQVSWQPPVSPNGVIISKYRVLWKISVLMCY